jgi:hypothetical protein
MLWNELCDQRPDPEVLIARLSKSGAAQLVLGTEAIYEMAKTFQMPSAKASERGQALFRYLKRFVDLAIPCVNMISDLLVYETRVAFLLSST